MQIIHKPHCHSGAPTYNPVYGVLACQWCGASVQYRTYQTNTTAEEKKCLTQTCQQTKCA